MRVLVLNGSPRAAGDTAALVEAFCRGLGDACQVEQVFAYRAKVAPCVDCRSCFQQPGCVIQDAMGEIYQKIAAAQVVVLASPLYFSTLTGSLLGLCSRIQALYAGRVRGFFAQGEPKLGVALLAGGGSTKNPECALKTCRIILREMGAQPGESLCYLATDEAHAWENLDILRQAEALGRGIYQTLAGR